MINENTRFTALGMSKSGKTCYIVGMYYNMSVGERGWTITTENADADELVKQTYDLDDGNFPPGTAEEEIKDYLFQLYYHGNPVMSFDWKDFAGGILVESQTFEEQYDDLERSIRNSSALYIFLDGTLFCGDDIQKKKKAVKRKAACVINPFITKFRTAHAGELPPIVFVITKSDLLGEDIEQEEIRQILEVNFSSILDDRKTTSYIVCVSLGKEIENIHEDGEVDPVNIQTPFFIGIYHEFYKRYQALKVAGSPETEQYYEMLKSLVVELNKQSNDFMMLKGKTPVEFDIAEMLP